MADDIAALKLKIANLRRKPGRIVQCSHCGHEGPAEKDFGFRRYKTQVNPYTWCRSCRASPCSHAGTRLALEPGDKCEHGRIRTADGWR